jgi:hypothetical protein
MCYIVVAGIAYCPILVTPDQGQNDFFKPKRLAHATTNPLRMYLETVLLPAITANGNFPDYQNKPAIVFWDNRAYHCSEDLLFALPLNCMLVLTYHTHTSNLFLVMDLLLFCRLQRGRHPCQEMKRI